MTDNTWPTVDTELIDDSAVTLDVLGHQIVQHLAALTDHLQQAAAGVMILLVGTEVLGEVVDSLGENGDLNFRGTRVALMACILLDDLCLFALQHCVFHLF